MRDEREIKRAEKCHEGIERARPDGCFGCDSGFLSMTNPVNDTNKDSTLPATNQVVIAGFALTGKDKLRHAIVNQRYAYCVHFFTVTVVPRPGWEAI